MAAIQAFLILGLAKSRGKGFCIPLGMIKEIPQFPETSVFNDGEAELLVLQRHFDEVGKFV